MEKDSGSNKKFRCEDCDVSYSQRASLSRHRKTDHGPTLHAWCRRCDFKANRKDNLRRHYKQSHASFEQDLDEIQLETGAEREARLGVQEVRVNQVRQLEDAGTWEEAAGSLWKKMRRRAPATVSKAPEDGDRDQGKATAVSQRQKVDPLPAAEHAAPEQQQDQVLDLTMGRESPGVNQSQLSLSPTRSLLDWDIGPMVRAQPQGGKPRGMMAMVRDGEDQHEEPPAAVENNGDEEGVPVERIRLTRELRGKIIKIDEVTYQYSYADGERRRTSKRRRVYHVQFDDDYTDRT